MKRITLVITLFLFFMAFTMGISAAQQNIVLVIHGGAGTIEKKYMTPEKERAYTQKLTEALQAGYQALKDGKSSVDAVQAAINVMEDSPLFNAGKGAVFTHDGRNEMDASIMNGANLEAGAVADVSTIKNPIDAARAVMEQSKHVMLACRGAEAFARKAGCTIVDTSYFYTRDRWEQLLRARAKDDGKKSAMRQIDPAKSMIYGAGEEDEKFGTVGCAALDKQGNLAAGTSTGGMTDKLYDRIGDSPIIGAGTYANNATCAISCTGWGEYFMRTLASKTVSDLMEYKGMSLKEAADTVIMHIIPDLGGDGGLISVDKNGHIAMPFNTPGMFRGYIRSDGVAHVFMYRQQ
jgi:beta-aspartyl-peptidase (threonine type)